MKYHTEEHLLLLVPSVHLSLSDPAWKSSILRCNLMLRDLELDFRHLSLIFQRDNCEKRVGNVISHALHASLYLFVLRNNLKHIYERLQKFVEHFVLERSVAHSRGDCSTRLSGFQSQEGNLRII